MSGENRLDEWVAALESSVERTRALIDGMSRRQLNRSPGWHRWSVGQCLDHIGISTRRYLERMEPVLATAADRERSRTTAPGESYASGTWIGRLLVRALRKPGARYPAPPSFRPARDELEPDRIEAELASALDRLRCAMEAGRGLALGRITMPWPVVRLARISLAQAFELLVLHTERHLGQAERAAREVGRAAPEARGARAGEPSRCRE